MKKIMKSAAAVLLGSVLFGSCYYDKSDLLYPNSGNTLCDTTGTISYAQKVQPLLSSQCYSCHTSAGGSGGINMATYANDRAIAVNGKLYGSISHAAGFSAMPKGGLQFSACQLATIKKWIDAGAPNN